MTSKKETASAEKIKIELAQAGGPNFWRNVAILLVLLFVVPRIGGCVLDRAKNRFTNWKESVIQRLVPTPPNPFERKTRPDPDKDTDNRGGIRWKFIRGVEGARSLSAWVSKNVPAGADPSTVYDVADAFYDAADAIRNDSEYDEPAEAVASVRGLLYRAADAAWVPFLTGLDEQANAYGVTSISDVSQFYYAVADALYTAAEKPRASAPAEADNQAAPVPEPPTERASGAPLDAGDCPNGQCPSAQQQPRYNYGYGNYYGWRWY